MTEGTAEPVGADRAANDGETRAQPYSPPAVTRLGTLAELTAGTNVNDGGDVMAYMS